MTQDNNLSHEQTVAEYLAAIYPNDGSAELTPEQRAELSEIISDIYDLQARLDDLAEEAGNAVLLSASGKIDEILKELEVFDVEDEPATASRECEGYGVHAAASVESVDDDDSDLPF